MEPGARQAIPCAARIMDATITRRVVALPGDGIGPEIVAATRRLLDELGTFEFEERPIGGASIDELGTPLADDVLEDCRGADAVLLGAVGGPKWDSTDPSAPRPEQGLLGLRKGLGLYANLRPVKPIPALIEASPLRRERIAGTDLLVVRELTGGIYFGAKQREGGRALTSASTRPPRSSGSPRPRSTPPGGAEGTVGSRASPLSIRPTCSRPRACGAR